MREPNLRRWEEIAVQYWTMLRIIIHVGLSDARTRISLRRFDTICDLPPLFSNPVNQKGDISKRDGPVKYLRVDFLF